MDYKLVMYIGKDISCAIDINNQNQQYISMNGNMSISTLNINEFFENILDYYNIDESELSNIAPSVKIINGSAPRKYIDYLFDKFSDINDISIINATDILPIVVLQKNLIKINDEISIDFHDKKYKISTNSLMTFSIEESQNADTVLEIKDLDDFISFNGSNLYHDENITLKHERRILDLQAENKDLLSKCNIQESEIFDLKEKMEKMKNEISNLKHEANESKLFLEKCQVELTNAKEELRRKNDDDE